ncbi:hypothetical protein KIH87_10355 [Paraneptunicella aestuarii]|uniref:WD40/YVTN/BNR-like repeat-containing protein n=1 Tax=Paraneptunicella aestuarii TaxID=2831148 RepID=UPI001E320673|nr:YCF48-related protein [Paraneptunicella aestuarii]UAA37149.1 hypothetical protein KIH87_10355 [Paraneptunicella aestuarii]
MKLTNFVAVACCFSLLSSSTSALAASESAYIAPLASKSLLLDIEKNGKQLVAVGERGHILLSDDGKSWQQQNVPTQSTLNGVYASGDHLWVVGHDAVILASSDAGHSWELQQFIPELERPLFDVLFFNEMQGIAVGAYGVFFRTEDGGKHWEREYHTAFLHPDDREYIESLQGEDPEFFKQEMASILPHLNRLSFHNGQVFVTGEIGLVAVSDDMGKTWKRLETGYYGSFFDVKPMQDGTVIAAGLRGSVYRSDQTLSSWRRIETGTTSTFNSIVNIDDQTTLLVGNNGTKLLLQGDKPQITHTEDGKALVSATYYNQQVLAVSEIGVKGLSLKN